MSQTEADDAKEQGKRLDREWRQVARSEAQRERIIHSCHSSLEGTNNYGTPNATKTLRAIINFINQLANHEFFIVDFNFKNRF